MHLFEFHDQPWFPTTFRNAITEYLRVASLRLQLHRAVAPLIAETLRSTRTSVVIDLCSGGSGPILPVIASLAATDSAARAVLTDKFPNAESFRRAEEVSGGLVRGYFTPVDATDVPPSLEGLRTIFNAFHHFTPPAARAILKDAFEKRQPIAVFEMTDRGFWSTITMMPFCFLAMLFVMPFTRPVRASWLFFTYLVPILPLSLAWDGLVSQLRSYTGEDFKSLTAGLADEAYGWKSGRTRVPGNPVHVTFLIGTPLSN